MALLIAEQILQQEVFALADDVEGRHGGAFGDEDAGENGRAVSGDVALGHFHPPDAALRAALAGFTAGADGL